MQKSLSSIKTRWLILFSLIALLVAFAPEPTDPIAVELFRQSEELTTPGVRNGEPEGPELWRALASLQDAEAVHRRIIARRPRDPQPWRMMGDFYAARGRLDEALHAYNHAIRRGDDTAALDLSLAQLHAELGDARQSARHLVNYLARHPEDRAERLTLAQTSIWLADWANAEAELKQLLADDARDAAAHGWLGLLLIGPDPAAGMPHLQRAADDPVMTDVLAPVLDAERLSAVSDDPAYRLALLGVSFLGLDTPAFQPPATSGNDLIDRSNIVVKKAFIRLAIRSLLAAVYHSPSYADAYAYLGQALDEMGWSDWALASLRYALQLAPESPVVQTLMGLYWDRRESPALARRFYEVAYKQDRGNVTLCLEIAATYAAEGEYTAAEVWLLYAADIAPNDARVWETLAHFYIDSGIDVEESGLAAANRLLELAPNDAQAHDLIGWAYYLINDDTQSQASLTQALALDPTLASAHYHLGRLHARQSLDEEASQDYRRAADLDTEGELTTQLERAWNELLRAGPGGF